MSGIAFQLIFFRVILILIESLHKHQLLPQDFADSLASHLSVTLISTLFLLLMARMFFLANVECLTPPEWPEAWEKAAEANCFTDGTYAIPHANANRTDGTEWNVKLRQDYYYWIPYIIIGQAVILKAPDFFWHYICDLHPKKPAETLKAFAFLIGSQEVEGEEFEDEEERNALANCVQCQLWSDRLASHLISRNELVNFDTWDLFALYMLFKTLRLTALLTSLLYLKAAFGLDSVMFGAAMAESSLHGLQWEATDLFPRWAFCDVHLRHLGQWSTRVVQCALPVNMLLEKALLFLWFWIVGCAAVSLLSAVTWCLKMLPHSRRQFALAYLSVSRSRKATRKTRRELLRDRHVVREFTAIDRVFMLRLVEERLGLAVCYLAMDSMLDAQLAAEV